MANWLRTFSQLNLGSKVLPVLVILCCLVPIIGSRSIGGSLGSGGSVASAAAGGVVVTFDSPPLAKNEEKDDKNDNNSNNNGKSDGSSSSSNSVGSSNPCALVSMSLDGKDGKLMSYEERSLITVSHSDFDVLQGIVPNILYKVELEIPSGHVFSLEYWVNGVPEERSPRLKRRHQRDRRDILELYFNSSSSKSIEDQAIFCSKSSLWGENKDTLSKVLVFNWFVNGNNIVGLSSAATSSTNNGLPPSIVFRLRFKSIVEATTSVFEQTLSVIVRSDCYLVMKVPEATKLTLNKLLITQTDNTGLNCTVLFLPKANFGLEIRIANFSIHGMRDICKGRYLTFSQSKHKISYENVKESSSEFPSHEQLSPLERKFCGKLEDYSVEERLLTFVSDSRYSNVQQTNLMSPNNPQSSSTLWSESRSSSDTAANNNNNNQNPPPLGILLQVNLPGAVKNRETFSLELNSLSPCQRVVLKDLEGELKYSKTSENDECSIVIHVPYGNKIISKMTLSRGGKSLGTSDSDQDVQGETESNNINEESDNNHSSSNNSINYYNYNDSDLDESGESTDNSIPRTSYECPVNLNAKTTLESGGGESVQNKNKYENVVVEDERKKYMIIRAEDVTSGSQFMWCFDGNSNSQAQHKRAWKSSGNKVKISFQLKYFDVFHLTYQTIKVPELTRDCEHGWISVDNRCVVLVETLSSWTSAEETCQLKGGHLATISSETDEQTFQKVITESALFHVSRAYWIGANDRESEGNFQWTSGLPFTYKNWFMGFTHKRNEIINAQPNDDGWSGQDCVEIRQILNTPIFSSDKQSPLLFMGGSHSSSGQNQLHSVWPHSRFYWNDRNCEIKNFFLCEKNNNKDNADYSCNRTLELSPLQTASLTVTSPAYPSSYPDNIVCVTMIETVPGYHIALSFDEFVLEESPSCQYDSLEISEIQVGGTTTTKEQQNRTGGVVNKSKRICGDWTKKLKLLRYTTTLSTTALSLKFESDFSHHFAGFKAKVWAEKDTSEQCSDQQMKKFGAYCYLTVSFPAVNWVTAQRVCSSLQGKLASVLSLEEWNFLTRTMTSPTKRDKKSTSFWIGGSIDQNSQLVWSDRMPFNFSAFHPSDLQTISDWKCLTTYWHEGGKGDYAWRLADCNQGAGYICKKKAFLEVHHSANKTYSGTGGKQTSPNYPSNYYNNLDYTYHLIAPRGTQIVIRFSHLDVEDQEDCFYDYVEIVDRKTRNSTRYCGAYTPNELTKLDYVSSSNEVDILFHTDFSDTQTGFEIVWRAVDVASCISGKTIFADIGGNGFPIQDAMIHSPNFPHFNLPNLNCVYTIVAPAGQRIWLSFQIFEMGQSTLSPEDCKEQDHVSIDLDGGLLREEGTLSDSQVSNDNEIILCGNLTSSSFRTSFISSGEKIRIRVASPIGKSGRGFLGKFKAISGRLVETLTVATTANASMYLTSMNFPLNPPEDTNITLALSSPPNYVLTVNINGTSYCPSKIAVRSYLEIRDPYHGTNGTTWKLCQLLVAAETTGSNNRDGGINVVNDNENNDHNDNNKMGRNEISLGTQMNTAISFRSTFNRLDIKQVYLPGFRGKKWNANVVTTLDENFRAKVLADGDRLLKLDGCTNSPCTNGGSCVSENGKFICRCSPPFTGPFCGLSLCDLNPCLFGDCYLKEKSIKCVCQLGYGGERCDRGMKPCDENPCSGHGNCIEVNSTSYKCLCHAWWEGPQCESRMLVIPFKPLSQRVLEEPFWLGLITIIGLFFIIGLGYCLKRHFPEKLEKLLNEDLDKNRGISWVSSGRSPSFRSPRAGGGSSLGMRDPIPGTSQQAVSPPTSRSFLGRFGIRKPSLLSLSSATSNVSVAAVSPHSYENRTFSLDDLLRPSRSMMRTPSPHRRRNYSVQVRRDPAEKQQILQQLVSGQSTSLDGEYKPITPKPTLAEIIQMSEKRLRLASASSMQSDAGIESNKQPASETDETSFTTNVNTAQAIKAEKKVTFARMLDQLAATQMSSSSSCSDVSCAEDTKMVSIAPKPQKKDRKGRFRRSKSYHRGRTSETDQDYMDNVSSSDTTPDPINPPRFPTRLCISPTGLGTSSGTSNTLSLSTKGSNSKIPKIASADSLLALFRRFSGGSNSAPPSPQYSENEESSAGATPLSTPSSPRSSLLSIRPPALLITAVPEPNNTIELPVIDPFAQQTQGWRANAPATSITLEVPMRDYGCLSPIHEVPTPIGTPSHSPCHTPMMRKRSSMETLPFIKILFSSEEDDGSSTTCSTSPSIKKESSPIKSMQIPVISISVDDEKEDDNDDSNENSPEGKDDGDNMNNMKFYHCMTGESEVIPDVLIHVPPDACSESQPEAEPEPLISPRLMRSKPPPLIFANEILSCGGKESGGGGDDDLNNCKIVVPVVNIEYATPVSEVMPKFPPVHYCIGEKSQNCKIPPALMMLHSNFQIKNSPLVPPMITINQSSEAESDSDTPAQRRLNRPNLCFLTPFAGASDRVPSESNLSTSGYSSMASPCPSRCPSVSPLCPSETEDYHTCSNPQNHHRRLSLTPGTPKKPPMTPRRSSLNAPQITSGLLCDNTDKFGADIDPLKSKGEEVEIETDSAVEVETDVDCLANMSELENQPQTPTTPKTGNFIMSEDMKCINSLLQVPKKGMPKSRSLDINVLSVSSGGHPSQGESNRLPDGTLDRKGYLRGPSLDSKLNSIDPSANGSNGVTIVFPLSNSIFSLSGRKNSGNLIEIPEEKERRLSPVSSRSESPLSELSAAGGCFSFLGSPLTDSDGVYDCSNSEVPTNNNETDTATTGSRIHLLPLQRLHPRRRSSGRMKDRKLLKNSYKLSFNQVSAVNIENSGKMKEWSSLAIPGQSMDLQYLADPHNEIIMSSKTFPHLDLPPNLARELSNSTGSSKRVSPKRRVRAQPTLDGSSSSSESIASSRPRSRTSLSSMQNSRTPSRNNSPLPVPQNAIGTNEPHMSRTPSSSHGGSLEEGASSLKVTTAIEDKPIDSDKDISRSTLPSRSGELVRSPARPKISRLRTISHQIRFLRRLELSLIRKRECLTQVSRGVLEGDRRDSILSRSDSAENSSRYDTSDSTSVSSDSCSECRGLEENEKLLSSSTGEGPSGSGAKGGHKRKGKVTPLNFIENITAGEFLNSHKKRIRKYK